MKLALVESMQYYAVSCSTIFGWFHHVSPTFCLCIPRILISPDFTYISHPSCLNHGMIPQRRQRRHHHPPGSLELSSRRRWCLGVVIPGAERTHGTQQSPGGWWAVFSRWIFRIFPLKSDWNMFSSWFFCLNLCLFRWCWDMLGWSLKLGSESQETLQTLRSVNPQRCQLALSLEPPWEVPTADGFFCMCLLRYLHVFLDPGSGKSMEIWNC